MYICLISFFFILGLQVCIIIDKEVLSEYRGKISQSIFRFFYILMLLYSWLIKILGYLRHSIFCKQLLQLPAEIRP